MRRPLLLSGFMATGKSTVGQRIAARNHVPFVDLDALVEERAGAPIAEIFRARGEPAFRALEAELLREQLRSEGPRVVALGGGALLRRGTRLLALERGVVVTLAASVPTILARTASDTSRPLLTGKDREARAEALLAARSDAYAESHARVVTDDRTAEEVAAEVEAVWKRDPIAVAAGSRSYTVDVGASCVGRHLSAWGRGPSGVLLVTDANVNGFYGDVLEASLRDVRAAQVVLTPGEEHKAVPALEQIWSGAYDHSLDRKGCVIAVGGGVVTDVAGFAAATWMRGVPWYGVPTTLLAMVDASVGGKTAVDFGEAKNAVGAFWQPSAVVCDVMLLGTEPQRGFVSALAEVVKTALIGDAELLELLEGRSADVLAREPNTLQDVVRRCIAVKAAVVGRDEREAGERAHLNLGHTLGHALESHGGYGRLTHGEAVSLGLVAALRIGERRGVTPRALVERVEALLRRLELPADLSAEPVAAASALVGHDKKRSGRQVRFILAEDVGRVAIHPMEIDEVRRLAADVAR